MKHPANTNKTDRALEAAYNNDPEQIVRTEPFKFINGGFCDCDDGHKAHRIPVGTKVNGKLLIPIHGRVGRKAFKAYVTELLRSGNAYFVKKNGQVLLMAENIKENDKPLAGFKRRYRKAEGISRLKRGVDIPIAVLVPKVTLPKRLDVMGLVVNRLPKICATIESEIASSFR